jgi:hypothetical protein
LSWSGFIRATAAAEAARVRAQARAAVRSLVLVLLAAVVLLIGVVFALAGIYDSLAVQMPSWQAGAIVAVGAFAVCLLLLLLANRSGSRPPPPPAVPPPRHPTAEELEATAELGAAASTAARDFVRKHGPSVLQLAAAAFVVGLVASRRTRPPKP